MARKRAETNRLENGESPPKTTSLTGPDFLVRSDVHRRSIGPQVFKFSQLFLAYCNFYPCETHLVSLRISSLKKTKFCMMDAQIFQPLSGVSETETIVSFSSEGENAPSPSKDEFWAVEISGLQTARPRNSLSFMSRCICKTPSFSCVFPAQQPMRSLSYPALNSRIFGVK